MDRSTQGARPRHQSVAMQFDLLSEWHFNHPLAAVWDLLHDMEAWPYWWQSVASVEPVRRGGATGVGAIYGLEWRTALPYRIRLETQVIAVEWQRRIEGRACGDLIGHGVWTLSATEGGTRVRYQWIVEVEKPWMRLLAPILRPLFKWNHAIVMERGRRGLAAALDMP